MNHVEWGVFWNSITVQAISRRCSGIGWTPISLRAPCHEFESITHSVSSLLSHGQFINETCYFNYRIFKMEWVLFCFGFFLISKHAVAWIFFPCWRSDFCMEMIICIAILVFLGIWKISPTCTVKDLVSKRSQWIMSSPRLLKHVLWTWFDNMAVLY